MRTPTTALLLCVLAACSSAPVQTGIRIGDETLDQFEAGKTTENWVLAILGEPSSRSQVADEPDAHVLRYSLVQAEDGGLFSLFGSSETTVSTIYFVVRKGVVERFWADRAKAPGLFGGEKPGEKVD